MLSIPIISEFDSKGVKKAIKEFKQLETNGQKAAFVLKKAGQAAAIAFAALGAATVAAGAAMWNFAKLAMDDQKSQKQLAASIKAVTKATDAQIKATEDWITKTQLALGVSDTDLRAGLARLVRSTKDVERAQRLLNISLDVSAATGKPLAQVVQALGRAYDGNNTALGKLGLGFDKATLKATPFSEIAKDLEKRFGGSASVAAGTFEGKVRRLGERFGELKESLGTAVLPFLEKLINYGITLGNVLGEQGLSAAVRMLSASLKQLAFYDQKGNLNALGKTIEFAGKTFNFLSRAGGLIGSAVIAPFQPGAALNVAQQSLTGTAGTMNTLNPYSDPFAARAVGGALPRVTINFNGPVGDSAAVGRQIQRTLDQYGRRIGRAGP